VWFRWPVHADLYITRSEVRLIGKTVTHSASAHGGFGPAIAALAKRQPKVSEVTVWLGGDLVRYGVLAPVQGKLSEEDACKLAKSELEISGVDVAASLSAIRDASYGLRTAVQAPDAAGRRVWTAITSTVEAEIRSALHAAGIKINGVAPVLTRLAGLQTQAVKSTKLQLLRETRVVTAVQFDQTSVASIRQIEVDTSGVSAVLERLQVQTGVPIAEMMLVDIANSSDQSQNNEMMIVSATTLAANDIARSSIPASWLREVTV
jgi:hypothetical protein